MVTQSPSRSGSMTVSQTRSIGASISIFTRTMLIAPADPNRMGSAPRAVRAGCPRAGSARAGSARAKRLERLPVTQRMLDRCVQRVQPHPEQLRGAPVADDQVGREALHQRADQLGLFTGY